MSMCFWVGVGVGHGWGEDKNEYVFLGGCGCGSWVGRGQKCACVCFPVNKCQRWILPGQACSCLQTAAIIIFVGSEISILLTNLVWMENRSLYRALWAVRSQFC